MRASAAGNGARLDEIDTSRPHAHLPTLPEAQSKNSRNHLKSKDSKVQFVEGTRSSPGRSTLFSQNASRGKMPTRSANESLVETSLNEKTLTLAKEAARQVGSSRLSSPARQKMRKSLKLCEWINFDGAPNAFELLRSQESGRLSDFRPQPSPSFG